MRRIYGATITVAASLFVLILAGGVSSTGSQAQRFTTWAASAPAGVVMEVPTDTRKLPPPPGSVDQPSIAVGNGSVWVDWHLSGSIVARGAPVTGLGQWGPFGMQQSIPDATGNFGGIAVGPGPNGGKVMVTYMNPSQGEGPSTIYVNVDADGVMPSFRGR